MKYEDEEEANREKREWERLRNVFGNRQAFRLDEK